MKNKIWLPALILLVSGLAVMLCVLAASGFRFTLISTLPFTATTTDLADAEITDIEIDTGFFDVVILPTEEGEGASVRHAGCAEYFHMIELTDGKLSIRVVDNRAWHQKIGIFNTTDELSKLELRLPKGTYQNLKITTASGDVTIGDAGFVFDTATVLTASGDTQLFCSVSEECQVSTASGDVVIRNVTDGSLFAQSSSGEITVTDCTSSILLLKTTSGDITLTRALLSDASAHIESVSGEIALTEVIGDAGSHLKINSTSGEILMLNCDMGSIEVDSTSGDVEIALRSGKRFAVKSSSGDTEYPSSDEAGGSCRVETTSGDIEIRVITNVVAQ